MDQVENTSGSNSKKKLIRNCSKSKVLHLLIDSDTAMNITNSRHIASKCYNSRVEKKASNLQRRPFIVKN